jgi:hypothetical protein
MRLLLLLFLVLYRVIVFSQNETAQQYYDFLLQEEITVGEELVKLSLLLKDANSKKLYEHLSFTRNIISASIEKVDDEDAFHKSKYLKDAFIDYLEKLKHLCKDDFKNLIDIISQDNLTENDKNEVQKIFTKINKHISDADESLKEARTKFIEKHRLKVQQQPFRFYLEQTKH